MKKKLLILSSIAALIVFGLLISTKNTSKTEIEKLREKHLSYLDNSPFKESLKLSKKERKAAGLPPNKYFEQMYELTIDPSTGRPHSERLFELQEWLAENRVPGEESMPWTERGPDNVGGRTRAIMFDPNDATNKRVFAGGVSGGLWVNDDITDANSAWAEVGIPQNLAISCITYDPNNTNIFYAGTGESYVNGTFSGNGLWKSNDGGATWSHVFGGTTQESTFEANTILTVNTPASIAGDYAAVRSSNFGGDLSSALTGDLVLVDDSTGTTSDGCEALTNGSAVSGKIAVIRRGGCPFVTKVLNAQNAGATAAIIVNNISSFPFDMGGTDGSITIPAIMVSKTDGEAIIAELASGVNATMSLSGSPYNGVVVIPGVHHINDIAIKDIGGGNSEIYVAAADASYTDSSPWGLHGGVDMGLYKKSTADGGTWDKLVLNTGRGDPYMPNDIEIAADGKIWVATTNSRTFGNGGGLILSSSNDGSNFILRHTIAGGARVEIAVSGSNAGTLYVLANVGGLPTLLKTTNEFTSTTTMAQPNDADPGIPANDFCRTQAFYDLMLEVDPTNDNILYTGGIDIFKSTDAGANWLQRTHWYGGFGFQEVHADQHAAAFGNNDPTKMLFANDGGVYYSSNSGASIQPRKTNYNTLQFYKGAIGQEVASEKLLAGAQDNGTQLINNASAGINSSTEIRGGDGCYVFIDKDNEYMIASYVYNSFTYHNYSSGSSVYTIDATTANNTNRGDFVNPSALDSDNNILYSNASNYSAPSYQINRYTLGSGSATQATLTNALLTRAPTAFKTSTFTTTTLFVGTADGKLLKLTNANASPTWTDISGTDFVGSVSCIELGATEDIIMVTFHNYGIDTNVMYTNDGGVTWQNKEGDLPDLPVKAVMMNPLNNNEVIIGTDLGVWASPNFNDATPNWYQAQNGMKDVPVTSFDLRTADNTVLASTYGRGMFTGQFTAAASGLSVNEFDKNDLIKVYPTVSNGEITISSIADIREGTVNVYDINGRSVHSTKVNFEGGLEQPLSLSLSSGMYVLKFSANEKQSSHKIIIE